MRGLYRWRGPRAPPQATSGLLRVRSGLGGLLAGAARIVDQRGVPGSWRAWTEHDPDRYFQRQCFISSDQDDPGIKTAIEAIGDDNIVTATDFSHPEGRRYGQAVEMLLALPGVSEESKRKILWDKRAQALPHRSRGVAANLAQWPGFDSFEASLTEEP